MKVILPNLFEVIADNAPGMINRSLVLSETMRKLYAYTGIIFMLIGVLHTLLGVISYKDVFKAVAGAGIVNSLHGYVERELAFWFTFTGLMMVLIGYLMDWAVRKQRLRLPIGFGYALTVLCVIGVLLLPASGFWLVLIQGVYLISYGNQLEH